MLGQGRPREDGKCRTSVDGVKGHLGTTNPQVEVIRCIGAFIRAEVPVSADVVGQNRGLR